MPGVEEDGHVGPDLADDVLGGDDAGAGCGGQLADLVQVRFAEPADPGGQLFGFTASRL